MSTEITLKPCPRCGRLPYKMLNGDGAFTPACACSKRELQAEIDRLKIDNDLLVSTLVSLAAVARRYLPDYDEHPEIQKADTAIEAAMRAMEEGK